MQEAAYGQAGCPGQSAGIIDTIEPVCTRMSSVCARVPRTACRGEGIAVDYVRGCARSVGFFAQAAKPNMSGTYTGHCYG